MVSIPLPEFLSRRAALPADLSRHEPASLERGERLPQGHPAHAQLPGELALRGKPVSGREPAGCDGALEPLLDLRVGRPAARLDRRDAQSHNGLDLIMIVGVQDSRLQIEWPDGHQSRFHAIWLRDKSKGGYRAVHIDEATGKDTYPRH